MRKSDKSARRRFLKSGLATVGSVAALSISNSAVSAASNDNGSTLLVEPPKISSLEVRGSQARFPVRRIYCLGRNYRAHAIESGDDPDKTPPFFFMKPADAIVADRGDFPYPRMSQRVDYEIELVVALQGGGKDITKDNALDYVLGYAVGLDMTRRDLQFEAKKLSRPWEDSKSFDHSAPCGPIVRSSDIGHPDSGRIWLSVNDVVKQDADIASMRWSVPESIAVLSQYFELAPGDLIYMGTPAGIGPIKKGDLMRGGVAGIDEIKVRVV